MRGINVMTERIVYRVPFVRADSLELSEDAPSIFGAYFGGTPLAVLELTTRPEAERLYRAFCERADPCDLAAKVAVWAPLAGDEAPEPHDGHPLLEFMVAPASTATEGSSESAALGFIVCAQCDADFVQRCSGGDWIAIDPDGSDPSETSLKDESSSQIGFVLVNVRPYDVALAELHAWRYAYTLAGPKMR
jgi:hypothetical protein